MTDEKKPKRKRVKAAWWGFTRDGNSLVLFYTGPDKGKLRESVSKQLTENPRAEVSVAKVVSITTLTTSDLKQTLPRDSF